MCAPAKSSTTSFKRTWLLFKRYSLALSRWTMRSIVTSSKSMLGNILRELSKVNLTFARLARPLTELPGPAESPPPPFQIISSPRLPRRDFMDCSPRTNLKASATFDLPEPFGPTMPVIAEVQLRVAFLANDLKPESSRDLRYILLVCLAVLRLVIRLFIVSIL